METTAKVLEVLKTAGKPLRAGEIAELAGLDKKETEKAMNQLKVDDKIVSPKRCFWEAK
ncbi:MAG: MarR family transcriptional regulator [Bacteroidota bacterium]|nr:MarR family transcriptional regulator [Bacteroidota bacterium]MDP4206822.1 MarR family transcriptional regulator [Bacteroidota bacterium]